MKKIYLAFLCVNVSFSLSYAQGRNLNKQFIASKTNQSIAKPIGAAQHNATNESKASIWTNDFSNSGDWTFTDNAGSGDNWVIGTGIPSGAYAIAGIASTTATNGFALFDSDLMCSGSQNADVTIVNSVNASAYSDVAVQFESYYRAYVGSCYVIASNDGINWDQYQVHGSVAANAYNTDNTGASEVVTIDVTPTIGNSATAYIGFRYIGGCDYAWMVDDVALVETPALPNNSLKLKDAWWTNTPGGGTPYIPYSSIPRSQLADINFFGSIENVGGVDQPNTTMTITLSGAGTGSFASSSYTSIAGSGLIDTVMAGPMTSAGIANGSYSVAWNLTSDSTDIDPSDNLISGTWDFEVTNSLYARDRGTYDGTFGAQDFDGDGALDPVEFLLDYQFYSADTILSIAAVFPGGTRNSVGQELQYNIYDPAGNPVFDGLSAPVPTYTLTSGDLTSGPGSEVWVELPLTDPFTGNPGYVVDPALGEGWTVSISNQFDSLFVGVSGEALNVGGEWTTAGISWYPADGSANNYFTGSCFMMRLNVTSSSIVTELSENETSVILGQNRPNPFKGMTIIPFTLVNTGNVTFSITDVTGKIIETRNLGVLAAGDQNIEFNGHNLAGGIYYYSLIIDGKQSTKKLTVAK